MLFFIPFIPAIAEAVAVAVATTIAVRATSDAYDKFTDSNKSDKSGG
jgi:hypothetical protein